MNLKFPYALLPIGLILGASALITPPSATPADDSQPFKVTADILSQKYCSENDGNAYSMQFKLHICLKNQTDRKLIIVKQPGHGMFWLQIAADSKRFSAEEFEYHPFVDWIIFLSVRTGRNRKRNWIFPELTSQQSLQANRYKMKMNIGR